MSFSTYIALSILNSIYQPFYNTKKALGILVVENIDRLLYAFDRE